jgi:hypothetical protein
VNGALLLIPTRKLTDPLFVFILALLGFLTMGYHPGIEDDGVYLAAIKADLQPTLYPHDSDFFRLQLQATVFDRAMAAFVHFGHLPVPWAALFIQWICLSSILWAAFRILQKLFTSRQAHWSGVALLSSMFTLPASGSAVYLADQHLHPRNIATALILFAIERTLSRKPWHAVALLLLSVLMHPIMACFGISLCFFLAVDWTKFRPLGVTSRLARTTSLNLLLAFPLSWIFEPPTPDWRRALQTRAYYFLYKWTWYEWLGAIGPLVIFWLVNRYAVKRNDNVLARCSLALLLYGAFQQCVAMILLAPRALIRVTPLQPMRYLQLEYIFLVLILGALFGRYVLKHHAWRWAVFLLAANGGMFLSQRALLPASEHIEWPGRISRNPWLQAFAWIRQNTPRDAYFALDPNYLAAPGEDYHSFRALAERSQLADAIKDTAVATQVPELASRWAAQVDAQAGWPTFQLADFERLRARFGVDWVLLSYPAPAGLDCRWHNSKLSVCRIPPPPMSAAGL